MAKNKSDEIPWYNPGFFEKKATFREFVILLFGIIFLYLYLHRGYWTTPHTDSNLLLEVYNTQKEIDKVLAPEPSTGASPDNGASSTSETSSLNGASPSVPLKSDKSDQVRLSLSAIQQLKSSLESFSQNSEKINDVFLELKKIDLAGLDPGKDIGTNRDVAKNINEQLNKIKEPLKKIESSLQDQGFFWGGDALWIEVIFWSLFGTLIYLIRQPAEYYIREDSEKDAANSKSNNYGNKKTEAERQGVCADYYLIRRKPQYYLLLLQSPFLTLVILFVLRATQFSIAGVSLGLSLVAPQVFVSLAFILGLYNKVAIAQLEAIVGAIFSDAYNKSVRKIDIDPYTGSVNYGEYKQFMVIPDVKVRWSIWSQPAIGAIDVATGMYIAPPAPGYSYDGEGKIIILDQDKPDKDKNDAIYKQVIIRAEREDDASISAISLVRLNVRVDTPPSGVQPP